MGRRSTESALYGAAYATAFDLAARSLTALGMSVVSADPAGGAINAKSSMGLMTWGETIWVLLRPVGDGSTQIEVSSALRFGLVDWGKNTANVRKVHGAIAAASSQDPAHAGVAPAAWHADPYQRHEHRWWDGQQWTGSVSDRGVVSADPPA